MTAIQAGDVTFDLDSEKFTLKCTLGAAMAVNDAFGNYSKAVTAIQSLDLRAMCQVVAAGLEKSFKDASEIVFRKGHRNLTEPVSQFILMLANGGRPIADTDKDGAAPGEA